MQPGVQMGFLQQKRGPQPVCAPGTWGAQRLRPGGLRDRQGRGGGRGAGHHGIVSSGVYITKGGCSPGPVVQTLGEEGCLGAAGQEQPAQDPRRAPGLDAGPP